MHELLQQGASALRKAALRTDVKEFILGNEVLFNVLRKAADRYIGGDTLEETFQKVIWHHQQGFACSVECLGEDTRTAAEAGWAAGEFVRIAQTCGELNLRARISLDLSHIGLVVSRELCRQHLDAICRAAQRHGAEVMISAEGVDKTDAVLAVYRAARTAHANLGITLQAYLHRTRDDFSEVVKQPGRIRVVKGAFEAPAAVALPRGEKLDEAYLGYVDQLLSRGHPCSVATHDARIQGVVKDLVAQYRPRPEGYEFESLYGIGTPQLAALRDEGHPTRVYFVYGRAWYLYLCNRLAEYPLNLFRALDDMVGADHQGG
jgi:proline dehydrogenase